MKGVVFICFLFTLTVTAQRPVDRSTVSFNKETTVLPMHYRNNTNPMITVMVNGRGPYKFMFDTGSPGLVKLDQRVVDELKLTATDSILAGDGSGIGAKAFPITVINTLQVGDIIIHDANAMVRNYNVKAGMDSIDGVIGMAFFNGVTVELNFENNQLIISKEKLAEGEAGVFPSVYVNGIPGVKLTLGNKAYEAIFDTGNMGGLTFHSNHVSAAMMEGEPRVIGRAQTVSNSFEMKEVKLNSSVNIGNIVFEKPTIVMNDVLTRTNIGVSFAKQMNITFDKTNQLVKLVKFTPKPMDSNPGSTATNSAGHNEYAGKYGDRNITVGADGFLYIQRPGGMLLKMIEKAKDEFGLEKVPGAVLVFERENGKVVRIKVSRDGANWETVNRG